MKHSKKPIAPSPAPVVPASGNRRLRTILFLLIAVLIPAVLLILSQPGNTTSFQPLVGKWLRPDGGYVLEVKQVSAEGRVEAVYLNPSPINVAKASAEREGDSIRLFVELRDTGYDGSTYTLNYDAERDELQGIYNQVSSGRSQRLEVVFIRNK